MIVYAHKNPLNNEIFYIGIGAEVNRAYNFNGRNNLWNRYVKKYGKPNVEILHDNLNPKIAYAWEIFYIKIFLKKSDGGILTNLSDGGECSSKGRKHSEETKRKLSKAKLGKPVANVDEKGRLLRKNRATGVIFSEERKRKISEKRKLRVGWNHTEETKIKMSQSALGKPKKEEMKRKLSEAKKGKKVKPFTEEHKKKIGEANKRRCLLWKQHGGKNKYYEYISSLKNKQ